MRLAANLVYTGAVDLAVEAESLGYDLVLAPEGYKSDAVSVLGAVAARTTSIGLASGVMQIPARTPGMAALSAATLDVLSGGRFRLGLGVSNPDVSEGWYGVPFDAPLARTREYVTIVRDALTRRPVRFAGEHYRLPSGDRDGAPLHLYTDRAGDVPVYLAAVGARNLRLAGEIADGWIGVFTSPETVRANVEEIRRGRRAVGKDLGGFAVVPSLPTCPADTVEEGADRLRGHYLYMLGIGRAEDSVHCRLATRLGYGEDVARVRGLLARGDRAGAAAAVPTAFIDETALVGPLPRLVERVQEYAKAGVTSLGIMVSAVDTDLAGRIDILRRMAEAADLAGVGA